MAKVLLDYVLSDDCTENYYLHITNKEELKTFEQIVYKNIGDTNKVLRVNYFIHKYETEEICDFYIDLKTFTYYKPEPFSIEFLNANISYVDDLYIIKEIKNITDCKIGDIITNQYKRDAFIIEDEFISRNLNTYDEYFMANQQPCYVLQLATEKNDFCEKLDFINEEKINEANRKIEKYRNKIAILNSRINDLKEDIENYSEKNSVKFKNNLKQIEEDNLCETITINKDRISITTKHLYMTEPYTKKRYSLGKMLFSIPFENDFEIMMYNLTEIKDGYNSGMQHPHIFDNGHACFGDTMELISDYHNAKDYYAVYITLLNFCQTANIDDVAGAYISVWDEVDMNNNIIRKGHFPQIDEYNGYGDIPDTEVCAICGAIMHENDAHYCECCGQDVCADCWNRVKYVCVECEDNYEVCSDCNRAFDKDDAYYTHDNKAICEWCYEDHYGVCDKCGEIYHIDDLYYDADTEEYWCNKCRENVEGETDV